jgi:hypothetical protein
LFFRDRRLYAAIGAGRLVHDSPARLAPTLAINVPTIVMCKGSRSNLPTAQRESTVSTPVGG